MCAHHLAPALKWIGCATAILVFLAALGFGFYLLDQSESKGDNKRNQAFERANTICGAAPRRIVAHGSSWSYGPWIEVVCKDGSIKAVTW